jgi:hypothetical protein
VDDLRQRFNEIDLANARAAAHSDRAIIEARLQIEEADELLDRVEAIRAAKRRRIAKAA